MAFLLEDRKQNQFPCLFQFLEATCIPWLVAHPPSSKLQQHSGPFSHYCHHISSDSPVLLLEIGSDQSLSRVRLFATP